MRARPAGHGTRIRLGLAAVAAALIAVVASTVASGAPAPTCFGRHATVLGTNGSDSIQTGSGNDVIISLAGRDYINSREGNDYVCAGRGDDNVHGAEGFNHLNGGPGADWLDGRRGPGNVVVGSKGADLLQAEGKLAGGPGNDTIESYGYLDPGASPVPDVTNGGGGRDKIYGCGGSRAPQVGPRPAPSSWAWPDCYTGGTGNAELLKGGADNDKAFGGGGNDRLEGNGDGDRLYGEDGNDGLNGGRGTDVCDQGPGAGSVINCP